MTPNRGYDFVIFLLLFCVGLIIGIIIETMTNNNHSKNNTEKKKILLQKNSEITCPESNNSVYTLVNDVFSGEVVYASNFKGINKITDPVAGEVIGESSRCKINPFVTNQNIVYCIHTKNGWISNTFSSQQCIENQTILY